MRDRIEKIGGSVIQHGNHNDRVYLMKLAAQDFPGIIPEIEELAQKRGYGKIFAKVPGWAQREFIIRGYTIEALVPLFYNTKDPAVFFGGFPDPSRRFVERDTRDGIGQIIEKAGTLAFSENRGASDEDQLVRVLDKGRADQLCGLYRAVFESYPFPVFDPDYIRESMENSVVYFGIFDGDTLVAASGADMDMTNLNAEMTDFAVLPRYRGKKLSPALLKAMEKEMEKHGITVFYTIARAMQAGINITFAKAGYLFAGTLINNTRIAGGIESMNVWYRIGF